MDYGGFDWENQSAQGGLYRQGGALNGCRAERCIVRVSVKRGVQKGGTAGSVAQNQLAGPRQRRAQQDYGQFFGVEFVVFLVFK